MFLRRDGCILVYAFVFRCAIAFFQSVGRTESSSESDSDVKSGTVSKVRCRVLYEYVAESDQELTIFPGRVFSQSVLPFYDVSVGCR